MNKKFRFHQVGIYHLPADKKYLPCAYTQKIIKMISMLRSLGHEVIYYGAEGSKTEANEQVITHTMQDIRQSFGDGDNRFELGYDWTKGATFRFDEVEPLSPVHTKWIENTITEINKRKRDGDFLLLPQGGKSWKKIADGVNILITCETGVGYHDTCARFKAYESEAVRNFISGMNYGKDPKKQYRGDLMDRVIPNYFEDADFPDVNYQKKDYFLYMGRTVPLKGVKIAYRVAEKLGKKLIIAGQAQEKLSEYPNAEYVGVINDPKAKAKLMGEALATFVPSLYLEPFGGVAVESMLCGTPIITTDFGVFPEYNINGFTGFLCNKFSDFVDAGKKAAKLNINAEAIRSHASKYLMSNVKYKYQEWFEDIFEFIEVLKKSPDKEAWYKC